MAAREVITTPDLEAGDPFEKSLAEDVLKSNLDASLTLNRKRSGWFSSTRMALARGALQAKSFVDSVRGAMPVKAEERSESRSEHAQIEHHSFSPKAAINSFRQQIGGSRSRRKRGALADFYGSSNQIDSPDHPEKKVDSQHIESSPRAHSKGLSLGRNLVGSIRSMTTKHTRSPPGKDQKENVAPTSIPLPPSPVPPPALTVDIGTGGELVPNGFSRAIFRSEEDSNVTSPTTVSPERDYKINPCSFQERPDPPGKHNITPVLDNKLKRRRNKTPPEDAEGSKVFERGVAITESKSLKRIISLDAMAERCTHSPYQTSPDALLDSRASDLRPALHTSPATTVVSCPSDMEEISRQPRRAPTPTVLLESQSDGEWRSDDPFAPSTPSIKLHGPDTELPFRPKLELQMDETDNGVIIDDLSSFDGHVFRSHSPAIIPSSPDHKPLSSAEKHRSMVSEVLEIGQSDVIVGVIGTFDTNDVQEATIPQRPRNSNVDRVSAMFSQSNANRVDSAHSSGTEQDESEGRSNVAVTQSPIRDTSIERDPTPTSSEKTDGSDSALLGAVMDNYDFQVALGGVEITCDEKLQTWLNKSEDDQERDPNALSPATIKSYGFDVLIDDIGGDTSESINTSSVLETKDHSKEDSLDEALEMYRTYSAEHEPETVERLTKGEGLPTSPATMTSPASSKSVESTGSGSSTRRKPLPIRYRSKRGRQA